jgi:type IV fimbrial biogenesis protein FimT
VRTPEQQQSPAQRGFTLIEFLVVLAVVAIALGVGVPAFTAVAANQRMSTATNDLVVSLRAARSQALMRRAPVALCPTPDGAGACVAGGNLGLGWTVFVDRDDDGALDADEVVLERHGALPAELPAGLRTSDARVAFTDTGSLRQPPGGPVADFNLQLCDARGDADTGGGIAAGRWIQVSALGRQQLFRARADLQSDRNPLGGC